MHSSSSYYTLARNYSNVMLWLKLVALVAAAAVVANFQCTFAFISFIQRQRTLVTRRRRGIDVAFAKERLNVEEEDWREFRAKLLDMERNNNDNDNNNTTLVVKNLTASSSSSSHWAYDTGTLIEKGSLVVSKVEPTLGCHDLDQPYYHKAVVLILDHDDELTKGLVLNRPTNLLLSDKEIIYVDDDEIPIADETPSLTSAGDDHSWNMSFGGIIGGLFDEKPEISFLHSVTTDTGKRVSNSIMKDILVTSHNGALTLVAAGEAVPSDFYVFYGFAGWEKNQLEEEIQRGSWSIVTTDSGTILEELLSQRDKNDPLSAGLEMWNMVMDRIGKGGNFSATGDDNSFSDLMLKEWAAEMLVDDRCSTDDEAAIISSAVDETSTTCVSADEMIFRALTAARSEPAKVGMLVRGSSLDPSPFLLHEQGLHKSIVLVFQDDERFSIGLILNHPTTNKHRLDLMPGGKDTAEITIRHGGSSHVGDDDEQDDSSSPTGAQSPIWLHSDQGLRDLRIGAPLGDDGASNIWSCSQDQVMQAIDLGLAFPEDFMAVEGFNVWEKDGGAGGIQGEILAGNFELVDQVHADAVWNLLMSQDTLSATTIDNNIKLSNDAWSIATTEQNDDNEESVKGEEGKAKANTDIVTGTKSRHVHGSTVEVSKLADDALRVWMTTFLLGDEEKAVV